MAVFYTTAFFRHCIIFLAALFFSFIFLITHYNFNVHKGDLYIIIVTNSGTLSLISIFYIKDIKFLKLWKAAILQTVNVLIQTLSCLFITWHARCTEI